MFKIDQFTLYITLDLIPDVIPVVGLGDDLVASVFAIKAVYDYINYITPVVKEKVLA